jgi:hypothetical protein
MTYTIQDLIDNLEYSYDEEDKKTIISAIETAQSVGVYLDDLEELKQTVDRIYGLVGFLIELSKRGTITYSPSSKDGD